jgi:hypothetical protein
LEKETKNRRKTMAPIIPAGGKKMDWAIDLEKVEKKAQMDMLADDPQLSAIKDLPGMHEGIEELRGMSCDTCPEAAMDGAIAAPAAGGAVEQAIEKVRDAAQGVADAAVKDVEKAVSEAVKNVGKPLPVADVKVEEIAHEKTETPAEEAKEEHEKSETPAEENAEETAKDIPGLEGEKEGKAKKEGDKDKDDKKDDEKPAFFASGKGMKRIAELSSSEVSELRHYWKDMLGFPSEYVDAMLKKYKA